MFTGRSSFIAYRRLLRFPGATRLFAPSTCARSGVAVLGLGVFWAVYGAGRSFTLAGAAAGAFAIADASVGAQVGRVIDSWGQRRVLPLLLGALAVAILGLLIAPELSAPHWALVLVSAAVGAVAPLAGACAAARWRRLTRGSALLRTAFAVEGSVNDVAFLAGPVVVTTLSATVAPWLGVCIAGALVCVGVVGLLSVTGSEPARAARMERAGVLLDRRLLRKAFAALFAANLAMGFFFGGIGIAIAAFTLEHGVLGLTGIVTAAAGAVSLAAGLVYGTSRTSKPFRTALTASSVIAVGTAALSLVPSIGGLIAAYAVVGGCVALVLIPASLLLQRTTHPDVYTQAMTWMNSASATGIAVGAPITASVVELGGPRQRFLALAALTAVVPVTLLVNRHALTEQ